MNNQSFLKKCRQHPDLPNHVFGRICLLLHYPCGHEVGNWNHQSYHNGKWETQRCIRLRQKILKELEIPLLRESIQDIICSIACGNCCFDPYMKKCRPLVNGWCKWHSEIGCTLPREKRPKECNTFLCNKAKTKLLST